MTGSSSSSAAGAGGPPGPFAAAPPAPVLSLGNVTLQRGGKDVLAGAQLELRPGELLVLSGARGAGKSSLLAVAAGALRPQGGCVFLGGRDLLALQRSSLPFVRRNVGYLPAEAPLISNASALENVLVAPLARGSAPAQARAQAADLLAHLGLGDALEREARALSSGARRLVAIARALCGPPAVVLLDDPTRGLEAPDREAVVAALLGARAVGAAALVASGDEAFALALAERGARRVRLDEGRLVAAPALALVSGGGAGAGKAPSVAELRARGTTS